LKFETKSSTSFAPSSPTDAAAAPPLYTEGAACVAKGERMRQYRAVGGEKKALSAHDSYKANVRSRKET